MHRQGRLKFSSVLLHLFATEDSNEEMLVGDDEDVYHKLANV